MILFIFEINKNIFKMNSDNLTEVEPKKFYYLRLKEPIRPENLEDWEGPPEIFDQTIHKDKLIFEANLPYSKCDQCQRTNIWQAYRCKDCDYDCCLDCFLKLKYFRFSTFKESSSNLLYKNYKRIYKRKDNIFY